MGFIARFVWLAALLIAPAALAATVQQVEVIASVVGDSPLDAQEKAIDYAKKRAFFLTLSKFAPERAEEIATSLTSEQINSIVRGYELLEDKTYRDEPNRYLAKYKVSVSEPMVRRLIAGDSAANANDEANVLLILPAYSGEEGTLLWEPENVWRSLWGSVVLESGEGILLVPYGDPNDQLELNGASVLGAGYDALAPMLERYGAGEAVIVQATPLKDTQPPSLSVVLRRVGPDINKAKELRFETDGHNPTPETLLPTAAREAATQLKEIARTYQGAQLKRLANAKRMSIRAEFSRLSQWVSIQEKLEKLPRALELRVDQISIDSAQATLLYETTPEMMQEIMRAAGLFLEPRGEVMIVRVP